VFLKGLREITTLGRAKWRLHICEECEMDPFADNNTVIH
jgi:hypothetical protein